MGTTLTGTTPQDTYDSLIKVTDNGPLSGTAKYLSDGLGNDSALALSTTAVGIGTTAPVGILHLYKAAAAARLAIDGDAGQNRLISYRTGALQRFGLYVNNTAESGSNAGSNFAIRAYSDAGTLLSTPFFINRATGNVGIGTSTASRLLTLKNNAGATNGISFQSLASTSEVAAIQCNQTLDTIDLEMVSTFAGCGVRFLTGFPTSTERARFTANGLTFNGDTAAANALDDYEEGSFTPTIIGTTTAGTATYTVQNGKYTKIGRQVSVSIDIQYTGGTGTGNLQIAGLPFTVALVAASASIGYIDGVSLTALNIAQALTTPTTTTIDFYQTPTGGGSATAVPYDAAALIAISITYFV